MIFYGNGIIWNPDSNGELCKFDNGIFETYDILVIRKLKELGYKFEIEIENEIEEKLTKTRSRKK